MSALRLINQDGGIQVAGGVHRETHQVVGRGGFLRPVVGTDQDTAQQHPAWYGQSSSGKWTKPNGSTYQMQGHCIHLKKKHEETNRNEDVAQHHYGMTVKE